MAKNFAAKIRHLRIVATDILLTAVRSIWANRQRAFLTSLGIVTGCLAFTGSYGILWGKFESDLQGLRRLGATFVSVAGRELHAEHGRELAFQIPQLESFSAVYAGESTLRTRLATTDAQVIGAAASIREIYDLELTQGRFFTRSEVSTASNVCVIGSQLATALRLRMAGDATPEVSLFGHTFRVIGVMEPRKGNMPGCGEYKQCVVLPHQSMREIVPTAPLAFLAFHAKTEDDVPPAVAAIRYRLRRMLGRSSFDSDGFKIHQASAIIERIKREFNTGGAIIMGIVCLTLLVGGIGVMNIMLVTVVERTPEIGLRKAVGARSREILMQFLVESLCLCTGGGVIGTLLGVVSAHAVIETVAKGVSPVLPWPLLLTSIGFAVATGLFFGLAPAVKASRLNPIEALRRD